MRATLYSHDSVPGLATWGLGEFQFSSEQAAEEAMEVLGAVQAYVKYNSNYLLFTARQLKVMQADPFFDLPAAVSQFTKILIVKNIPVQLDSIKILDKLFEIGV